MGLIRLKKIYLALLGLMFFSLLIFTIYGSEIYAWGKPVVTVRSTHKTQDDETIVYFPSEALYAEEGEYYVYALRTEQGYSRRIYTVERVAVDIEKLDTGYGTTAARSGALRFNIVVIYSAGELHDGVRVVLK
jgi:hypothetical protein